MTLALLRFFGNSPHLVHVGHVALRSRQLPSGHHG